MKTETTMLRRLWQVLSAGKYKILPNQVCFYHTVFAFTNPEVVSEEVIAFMENACSPSGRDGSGSSFPEIRRVQYLFANALDGSSSNVGKHINNIPHFTIPPSHVRPFRKPESRGDIIRRLSAALHFSILYLGRPEASPPEICKELYPLLKKEFQNISPALCEAEELDLPILAIVIYDVVNCHLQWLSEPLYQKEAEKSDRTDGRLSVKVVDMEAMSKEYLEYVDCYGSENIDRYFALLRYADKNVLAAEELGCIYYYGKELSVFNEGSGNHGHFYVDADMDKAAHYFFLAASTNPPCIPACWSLGYMLLNMQFPEISGEEAVSLAETYFKVAAAKGYMPACNSLGMIYQKKADRIFSKAPKPGEEAHRQMLELYIRALHCYDRAGNAGWPYGHNNIAAFLLEKEKYRELLPFIEKELTLLGPLDSRERYLLAAEKKNLWAMDQGALLEYEYGHRENAAKLWKEAAQYGYSEAALHLAQYLYSENGESPDSEKYMEWMKMASKAGSALASCILGEYFSQKEGKESENTQKYVRLASKQNYEKFSNTLYRRIQKLQIL